jgi:hypothetical protein
MIAPDTIEIKTILRNAVSHGTVTKVANILGVSAGDIAHRFDPSHDRKVNLAEGLRELWAIACSDPDAYQIVKTYLALLLDSWAEPVPTSEKSLSGLIGEAAEKLNNLQRARFIEGRSENVQREETLAVITSLQQFLAGLGKQLELKQGVTPIKRTRNAGGISQ